MSCTIVILNYNGWRESLECLNTLQRVRGSTPHQSLWHGAGQGFEVRLIIIDNASKDESVEKIKGWISSVKDFLPVELVELKENLGFSGGNNVGMRFAAEDKSDYVLLLNNDTFVKPDFLNRLITAIESDERIGIAAPKIYFAKGYEFHADKYKESEKGKVFWYAGGEIDWGNMYAQHKGVDEVDKGQYDQRGETDFASGCCMLIKCDVIERIGFLDDQLYLYLEDLDFCLRARDAGYKIIYEPESLIWHKNASSSGKPGSKLHQYYLTRNRLIAGVRYAPLRTKIALLRESMRFLQSDNKIKRKAVLDFYFYNWGKAEL